MPGSSGFWLIADFRTLVLRRLGLLEFLTLDGGSAKRSSQGAGDTQDAKMCGLFQRAIAAVNPNLAVGWRASAAGV